MPDSHGAQRAGEVRVPRRRGALACALGATLIAIGGGAASADGPAHLVKNINTQPSPASSDPADFVEAGDLIFFTAYDFEHGRELWRTDGTPDGTALVRDIAPGPRSSNPVVVESANGAFLFAARDGAGGLALWRSDGTEQGTVAIADLPEADVQTFGGNLFRVGNELWGTKATGATTAKLAELPGADASATDGIGQRFVTAGGKLWRTDATPAGTVLLGEFAAVRSMSVSPDGSILFFAEDGESYISLWRSDGTPAGTAMVSDFGSGHRGFNVGYGGTGPHFLGDSLIFFVENYLTEGFYEELWRSDGTPEGTRRLGGFSGWDIEYEMVDAGCVVFFIGNDGGPAGEELWKTDGTPEGTALVADIRPGAESSLADIYQRLSFAVVGDQVYFLANDGKTGVELWRSDGSAAGTSIVADLNPGPANAFFFYDDLDAYLPEFNVIGDTLVFVASDGVTGYELWKTDGTAAGTTRISDAAPGPADLFGCWDAEDLSDCHPAYPGFLRYRDGLLFTAPGTERRSALWYTDLSAAGTRQIEFSASLQLWTSFTATNRHGALLLGYDPTNGSEPWWTDGTAPGTYPLKDIARADRGLNPQNLTALGDSVLFAADDGVHGTELWRSDGTEEGTVLVADVFPGSEGSYPSNLAVIGDEVLFAANDGEHGLELWKTDGTAAGTSLVRDIQSGEPSSIPYPIGTVGGTLLFSADDGEHGVELWRSDGTEAGTVLLADTLPGAQGGLRPSDAGASLDGFVLFAADTSQAERALWRSDGTAAGTRPILSSPDLAPLEYPSYMTRVGNLVYFVTSDEENLWHTDGSRERTKSVTRFRQIDGIEAAENALFVISSSVGSTNLYKVTPGSNEVPSHGLGRPPRNFVTAGGSAFIVSEDTVVRDGWYLVQATEGTVIDLAAARDRLLIFERSPGTNEIALWSSDGLPEGTGPLQSLSFAAEPFSVEPSVSAVAAAGDRIFFSLASGASGSELWVMPLAALPKVCGKVNASALDPVVGGDGCGSLPTPAPTSTPRPTRVPTASPTPRCADGACPRLRVSTVSASPGEQIVITVEFESAGLSITTLQNDLTFDAAVPIAARADGTPDCTVDAAVGDKWNAFFFLPAGCTSGRDCTKIRFGVFAYPDVGPIPGGALYRCNASIAADAQPGSYPLTLSNTVGFDPTFSEVTLARTDGAVIVAEREGENAARGAAGSSGGCELSDPNSASAAWPLLIPLLAIYFVGAMRLRFAVT